MAKILVTGGAGFLGSNLCAKLLETGNEVICLDNLLTGNRDNIRELESNPNFHFEQADVLNLGTLNLQGIEKVYHMASPASPNKNSAKSYHALSFETMQVNTFGTWEAAEFALNQGAKFLFASTSEAYGDPLEHPQKESYRGNVSTTGPRSVYDEAKRFGETITAAFVRDKGLDGKIIRIFNTYGPKMALDDGRVVIEFITHALKNEPIPIFGDGSQTRSFCYVSDLVEGIIKVMDSDKTKGEVINLGNPNEFTIIELAEQVKELTHSSSEIKITADLPEDDPLKRQPDITKARNLIQWEPHIFLKEGLGKLISYLQTQSSN